MVVTLGGERSVSITVFTYLADKYGDDVTVGWINAHPNLTMPGDDYTGYHAITLTAIKGKGDETIIGQLPVKVSPDKIGLSQESFSKEDNLVFHISFLAITVLYFLQANQKIRFLPRELHQEVPRMANRPYLTES